MNMGKFIVQCPNCQSNNTASDFLFAKKIITCVNCGRDIDVKAAQWGYRECPKCGVTYSYKKTDDSCTCPNCKTKENLVDVESKYALISCPQCSCNVNVPKNTPQYFCPLCDAKIDVAKELQKQAVQKDFASTIRFRGDNSILAWKHPLEDFNLGSMLIVGESQSAIFISNGQALDEFGPGSHTLETENLPFIRKHFQYLDGGKNTPFHADVYFFNHTVKAGIKWGTDELVSFVEPTHDVPLKMGMHGTMALQLKEPRKLLVQLLGNEPHLNWNEDGMERLRKLYVGWIKSAIKNIVPVAIKNQSLDIFDLNGVDRQLTEQLRQELNGQFEKYGLFLPELNIASIYFPEDDQNYQDLRELRSANLKEALESRRVGIAEIEKQRKIAQAGGDRANEYVDVELMRMKGITGKDELMADVEKARAQAFGQFGSNGASGGGMGSDLVGTMIGMKMANSMFGTPQMPGQAAPDAAPAAQNAAGGNLWKCACGHENSGKFCMECGKPKPEAWKCNCGTENTGKFCMNCGSPKPEAWKCNCGTENTGKFCMNCGSARPVAWDCTCGSRGNTGKCCPECGAKKPD